MNVLPRRWLKWIAVLLGLAGILTPALIELGWIPERQALNAIVFLLGFLVLDGAASRESSEQVEAPELFDNPADFYHAINGLLPRTKHEYISIVRANEIMAGQMDTFREAAAAAIRKEKQLHLYTIVAATPVELTEESFQRRFEVERDPSFEGRWHYRVIDLAITFGCIVFDQEHWTISFPSPSTGRVNAAIFFRNHPEEARLVAGFIRRQWLEQPGVTMSLSEAYEKWKVRETSTARVDFR